MSYRITDRKGKTIGYVGDHRLELLVMAIGGTVLLGLAIIIAPLVAIGMGLQLLIPWYLIFWNWATSLPLTPFPNLNGILVIATIGVIGGLLVRYARIHLILLYPLGHIASLVFAVIMAAVSIGIVFLIIRPTIGILLFVIAWLFSSHIPLVVLVHFDMLRDMLIGVPWLTPVLLPLRWVCFRIIGMFDKRDRFVSSSMLSPTIGFNFVVMAIESWAGMLLAHVFFSMEGISLLAFGAILGATLWGVLNGLYRVSILGEQGDSDWLHRVGG
jgi:hypothetical protein